MKRDLCSGAFLVKKNKFLFGKRSKKKSWAPGLWDIVGGRSKKNEDPYQTLQRETYEETGVKIKQAELMASVNVVEESSGFFKYHIYMVTDYKGKPVNCSKEHTKLKWFTRDELDNVSIALPVYLELIDNWLK